MIDDVGVTFLLLVGLAGLVGLAVYFAPTLVAGHRQHDNILGILLINLFFGWTLVGWVVALVWAVHERAAEPAPRQQRMPYSQPATRDTTRTPQEAIRELQAMLSEGLISQEEFSRKKQQILDSL